MRTPLSCRVALVVAFAVVVGGRVVKTARDWCPTHRAVFARLSTPTGSLDDPPPDNARPPVAASAR